MKPASSATQSASPILVHQEGNVLVIQLNRPEKRNAINDTTVAALDDVFSNLSDSVGAVVIKSTSENFSAGLDLSELSERDATEGVAHSRSWHKAFEKIEFGRVPVVSVLKGAVIGGGLELAIACHIRVAERSTYFALPEGQRGIFVGGGAAVRLPRLIGTSRMADMMLTGRTYGSEDAVALGFAQYVVDDGAGDAQAMELAKKMANNAYLTNFAVIHALPRISQVDPTAGYMLEALMSSIAQGDKIAKERVRDFLEKKAAKVKRPNE